MTGQRLYKKEKLCSTAAIDRLFDRTSPDVSRALAYPLRALWRDNTSREADVPQFLIMVPKKRLRHAVDRVAMRRRVREAYRLSRDLLDMTRRLDIAFIYVSDRREDYTSISRAMRRLLAKINPAEQ